MGRHSPPEARSQRPAILVILVGAMVLLTLVTTLLFGPLRGGGTGNAPSEQPATPGSPSTQQTLVGFVMPGSASDWGYNGQVERGRLAVAARFRDQVQTVPRANVPQTDAVTNVLQELCDQGARLIFVADPQYEAQALTVSSNNPGVVFMQFFSGTRTPNVGTYSIRDWESAFACGVAAAAQAAGTGPRFGFIGPVPLSSTRFTVNAFALGARSVHPDATVDLAYTGSWLNPAAEEAAVNRLAGNGVDAIYVFAISPVTAVLRAEALGVKVLAHFSDLSALAPENWITGSTWNWHRLFIEVTDLVLQDRWESRHYGGGFREGYATIAPFGLRVTEETRQRTHRAIERLRTGELEVFAGPIRDNEGVVRVEPGDSLGVRRIFAMDWLVEGVRELNPE